MSGRYYVRWDRIPAQSNVTHAVVLRPIIHGVYNISYARISYIADSEGTKVESYSSAPGYSVISSYPEYARKHESHVFDWLIFSVMIAPSIAIPFFVWYQSHSKYENLKLKKA